jgi:hypothetical protein
MPPEKRRESLKENELRRYAIRTLSDRRQGKFKFE